MRPEKISALSGGIGAQRASVLPCEMGDPYDRLNLWTPIAVLSIVTLTVAFLWAFSDLAQVVNERWLARADSPVAPWVIWIFKFYFVVYACGSVLPFALFLFWRSRIDARQTAANDAPLVTIIIPAFNEEANIFGCLAAVLYQDYPFCEVIVLDDGSSDYTPYLIENSGVKLLRLRSNQGKASALNLGVRHAKGDILVFSDADSMLDPSAVGNLVRRFSDPTVGAVAGRVMVARPAGWLRCWQELEYVLGQVIVKAAQIGHGSSALICPGPVCAVRRDLLLRLGGFKNDTLVEDFDLTLDVIRAGYQASYEPFAVARTETRRPGAPWPASACAGLAEVCRSCASIAPCSSPPPAARSDPFGCPTR